MLNEKVICAGFGGQGVMSMGQLLTYAGMVENKQVSWLPSYGPEMRGGTANCNVMVSDSLIGSPIINRDATCAIVMNMPSLVKFEIDLLPQGKLLINSSLIDEKPTRTDVVPYYIPANEEALALGNARVANMIMLGAYIELTKAVSFEALHKALEKVFSGPKAHLIGINIEALEKGASLVR